MTRKISNCGLVRIIPRNGLFFVEDIPGTLRFPEDFRLISAPREFNGINLSDIGRHCPFGANAYIAEHVKSEEGFSRQLITFCEIDAENISYLERRIPASRIGVFSQDFDLSSNHSKTY